MEEAEDARRRECQTAGQDQAGRTPFSHPIPSHGPKFHPPQPLPICLSHRDTSVAPQSRVCQQQSSAESKDTAVGGPIFTPLITQAHVRYQLDTRHKVE